VDIWSSFEGSFQSFSGSDFPTSAPQRQGKLQAVKF
jgi:hypothetical protein